jgi:DNA-binding transcriptional ArsR family regulator
MGGDKTIKVSKKLTVRYNIISDVLVSPARLEILNKLFDSPEGLSFDELVEKMPKEAITVRFHLDVLLKDNIVEERDVKYFLSENGLDFYYVLGKAAKKVQEEGLLTRSRDHHYL